MPEAHKSKSGESRQKGRKFKPHNKMGQLRLAQPPSTSHWSTRLSTLLWVDAVGSPPPLPRRHGHACGPAIQAVNKQRARGPHPSHTRTSRKQRGRENHVELVLRAREILAKQPPQGFGAAVPDTPLASFQAEWPSRRPTAS
jgi:hypothetical protein